jgi:D-serine deaminase-like pyridoxal phosphate-dependent protein
MTHAGHSYAHADAEGIARVAQEERDAAVASAEMLRAADHDCEIVSVGSSPTMLFAPNLNGVTEVRAGVGIFWDLDQYSRGVCDRDDIAVGVLASVIGHNRAANRLIIDAGSLALSKDLGANKHMPDVKYGLLCDPVSRKLYEGLAVETAYQEHGVVPVKDPSWFDRLPIGTQLLVLPNHICLTAAAYDGYYVIEGDAVIATWSRVNGW